MDITELTQRDGRTERWWEGRASTLPSCTQEAEAGSPEGSCGGDRGGPSSSRDSDGGRRRVGMSLSPEQRTHANLP